MSQRNVHFLIIGISILIVGVCVYLMSGILEKNTSLQSLNSLPFYGPKNMKAEDYSVPDFSFTNQDNEEVTLINFKDKIWVTDFFFTTCTGICPIMKTNMAIVLDSFRSNDNVMMLSHTVEPEHDSVNVLKSFSLKYGNINDKWHFVTGDKAQIYKQARKAYFIAEESKNVVIEDDFVHSQNLALIDRDGHIRGFYDGTDTASMKKLVIDIRSLTY
jgi:protein SCO1